MTKLEELLHRKKKLQEFYKLSPNSFQSSEFRANPLFDLLNQLEDAILLEQFEEFVRADETFENEALKGK